MNGKIRIAIMSDLHVEFDRESKNAAVITTPSDGHPVLGPDLRALKVGRPDVVILAGDIDEESPVVFARETAEYLGAPVVLIAGNHEFFWHEHPGRIAELRSQAVNCRNVAFLENEVFETKIRETRLRVLGCTLWTDYALFGESTVDDAMRAAASRLDDHIVIRTGLGRGIKDTRFRPADALCLHRESVSWLEAELAKDWEGATVVATHHAPSVHSVAERFRRHALSPAYVSGLDELVARSQAALWVHGHTHVSFDYRLGNTRVVCNPRGYGALEERADFNPAMIVEV